ncbi:uncharacterized protein TrAFT101_003431 [Trichoderma asperellum]|uniref:uncharacterized protein n=1 Tax=Trichoderma asperellum TaxID=101201 RepID=UPI003330E4D0|nr:hypothetical protein TrAFT101_003431 [Trichoderma asperellum]
MAFGAGGYFFFFFFFFYFSVLHFPRHGLELAPVFERKRDRQPWDFQRATVSSVWRNGDWHGSKWESEETKRKAVPSFNMSLEEATTTTTTTITITITTISTSRCSIICLKLLLFTVSFSFNLLINMAHSMLQCFITTTSRF